MDPRLNPFAPGAGTPPPELAGRDELIERAAIALDRIRAGKAARSIVLYGLRGVGKTVLLNRIRVDAETRGFLSISIETPEERSLPAILVPALRSALIKLSKGEAMKSGLRRAFAALSGFAKALKVKFGDIEVSMENLPELGLADSGDLDSDLTDLLSAVGEAAKEGETAAVIFIDELQYVEEAQFAALISALHRANQKQLPITIVGAGLPQLVGLSGRAKSYAERLFEFVSVDKLTVEAAAHALKAPVEKEGAEIEAAAVDEVLKQTQCYPYFLQEWGKHSWDIADKSPIEKSDSLAATARALAELDASFFRVRFDRLTPGEKNYVKAMAELGAGPHRSGDISDRLGRKVNEVAPVRASLIKKGMVFSPSHGDIAFTVPLFDGFVRRTMG
jgi:AAA ATPase domain